MGASMIHRDGSVWDDPDVFWPDRWRLTEDELDRRLGHSTHWWWRANLNYMPFSYGERICPSQALALLFSKFFIVRFYHKFSEVLPVHNGPYKANECCGTTIRNGLWLTLQRNQVDESNYDADSGSNVYLSEEQEVSSDTSSSEASVQVKRRDGRSRHNTPSEDEMEGSIILVP